MLPASPTAPPAMPPASPMEPMAGPTGPPFGAPSAPWTYWPPPPPKRKKTWVLVIVAVVIVAFIVLGASVAFLSTQSRATFVRIDKSGASGNSMFFNVTIRTSGSAIDVDHLHVYLRSLRLGATFDNAVYYNVDRIPGGREFVWNVDIRIDPLDEPSFTYVFTVEVNGSQTDSSTVS
jgi:hypothetical protein